MTTLKDIEKEIVAEFERFKMRRLNYDRGVCATCGSSEDHSLNAKPTFTHQFDRGMDVAVLTESGFLRAALTRVAEETKKAVMPESKKPHKFSRRGENSFQAAVDEGVKAAKVKGHNSCLAEMERNFKNFTEGV